MFINLLLILKQVGVDYLSLIITGLSQENEINNFNPSKKIWLSGNIPIIFLSNLKMENYRKLYNSTNYTFVKLPVHEDELINTIKNILSKFPISLSSNTRSSDYTSS